ncbi:hypothetical protein [Phreatobacter sp.]|uniref:hypothetical protein n=1 Tax=Phreatobacter sp. TaxID=1966341 RepID=UPI003F72F91F
MDFVGRRAEVRLSVTAEADAAAAFARATGAEPDPAGLPLTFPVAWLTRPEIAAMVASLAADRPEALPVHELQTIETIEAPVPGMDLDLTVRAIRTDADRITVEAEAMHAGRVWVRLTGILRLFDRAGSRP